MKRVKMNVRFVMILVIAAMFLAATPVFGLITVSNTNDSGAGSLRQALADAASGETIDFSVTGTITLTSGELTIGQNQTITGPGAGSLTIDGNDNSRIFYINSSGATVNISGLTLSNGNSANYGGGIENEGTVNISDCVISGCDANGLGNGFGGAIDNYGGTVNITTCTISGNTAISEGGGIRNENGTVTITESTISGNTSDNGGGIGNYSTTGSTVEVIRSTIYDNDATSGGNRYGGGIISNGGTLTLTNSTISGNDAVSGGGGIIDGAAATITITQCSITGNTSTNGGGGIELANSTANIKNTILAGNTGGNGNNYYSTGGTLNSQGYNLENATEAGFTGTGDQQNATPNLAPIADNGGPTQTHALQAGSDAIDAIPEGGTGYNGAPTTDQRGFDRTGANRDVGAFEYQGKPYISGNAGIAGATLSYDDGGSQTATADGSGDYSFFVSYNWSGTVTPSKTGYAFSPTNRSYTNVILEQTSQDYTATVGYSSTTTVAPVSSTTTVGNSSTTTVGYSSTTTVGSSSTTTIGNSSTTTVGNSSTTTIGNSSTTTVGVSSTTTVAVSSSTTTISVTYRYVDRDGTCGGKTPCYTSIQAAINAAAYRDIIRITDETYNEDVTVNQNKALFLEGGWNSSFTTISSETIITGTMTVTDKRTRVKNVLLK